MRLFKVASAAIAMALLTAAVPTAQAQDVDKKVAGGGITVPGWQGKVDAGNKQGLTINDAKFAPEGKDIRITTGAAASYWNPKNVAKGDFTVKATFTEPKQTYNHPHPFGVFIGGSKLDADQPNLLYCVAYRDGTFTVRQFIGGKPSQVARKAPHEAVVKAAGPEAEVKQEVGWTVKGGRAECVINGQVVAGFDAAQIVGAGKLESTDGVYGIRLSHNSDVIVSNFGMAK